MSVQKIKITGNSLPLVTSNGKYFVRYRIVSNDNALTSEWSTFYEFEGNTINDFTETSAPANTVSASVNPDRVSILLQWEPLGSSLTESTMFDIFSKWSYATDGSYSEDYLYFATVSSTNFSLIIPSGAKFGSFVVQLATQDKSISTDTIGLLGLGEIEISTVYVFPDFDGGTI